MTISIALVFMPLFKNEVLQLRANYGDHGWGLPGGALDPGETVHEALVRECIEEIGCDLKSSVLTGIYYHKVYTSHALIFRVEVDPKVKIKLSEEHTDYKYFPIEQLSPIQKRRVLECLTFSGVVRSAKF